MRKNARDEHLSVRLNPDEERRLLRRAELDHLDKSTWARQAILRALDTADALDEQRARDELEERRRRSVAEPPPPPPPKEKGKENKREEDEDE